MLWVPRGCDEAKAVVEAIVSVKNDNKATIVVMRSFKLAELICFSWLVWLDGTLKKSSPHENCWLEELGGTHAGNPVKLGIQMLARKAKVAKKSCVDTPLGR